ncbi:MAG: hypothetical protein ABI772_00895 [Bacteroidota bacterium]
MKQKQGRNTRITLRTSQKPKLNLILATGSIVALTAMFFIYINFSGTEVSKANNISNFKPDYRTTDADVSERLLLKPVQEINKPGNTGNPKTESISHPKRNGRSMEINEERYISE